MVLELMVRPDPMIVVKNSKMVPKNPVKLAWILMLLAIVLDLRIIYRSH